jgi:hypothetical protein
MTMYLLLLNYPKKTLLFLAEENFRPKDNSEIVGGRSNFSFFIESKYTLGK